MSTTLDPLLLAIDQGTTGSTAVLMDLSGDVHSRASVEFPQHFPKPGWVEHEPDEIWASILAAIEGAVSEVPGGRDRIAAIGIANQRETMLVWERETSKPVHRAIVWQDRRTSARCAELSSLEEEVRSTTGLVIDPYFSASKLEWLLNQEPELRVRARKGKLAFGTVDGFVVERLTGGLGPHSIMEVTNASRTLLMDLRTRTFSPRMCEIWNIPWEILPTIVPSAGHFGVTRGVPGLPDGVPISGIAGDQHAALFGQGCVRIGDAKCTYGTGAFVLANTGGAPLLSEARMLSTLAWQIGDEVVYALEGASFIAGAAVQWLRDGLGLIQSAADIEALARTVASSDGVVFVPALVGLGAPHWDPDARGLISGITRGTTAAHIARATLEAIAFQVDDLLRAMSHDLTHAGLNQIARLRVDGGAAQNDLLMQMQADISSLEVDRPESIESTARGAAMLAAIGAGFFQGSQEAVHAFRTSKGFSPSMSEPCRRNARASWEQAVARACFKGDARDEMPLIGAS
jgi:glycerol kinase